MAECTIRPHLALVYKNGNLITAATRGDGKIGENVTQNIKNIKNIPLTLKGNYPELIEIRGEVFLTKSDFQKINASNGQIPTILVYHNTLTKSSVCPFL